MPDSLPPASTAYLVFFLASLGLLFLIFCVRTPELWRSWRRFSKQMGARRTRNERMLADVEKLMADARRLEGTYCFESIEPHSSPSRPASRERVSSPPTSPSSSSLSQVAVR